MDLDRLAVRPTSPCVGALELLSIARGLETADAVLKEAPVTCLHAGPIDPGKFLVLFTGEVEEVLSSLRRGRELAGDLLLDELFIPNLHPDVLHALRGKVEAQVDALGVIECAHVSSIVLAADRAAKKGNVRLLVIRLAQDLGGKGYVVLTGEVSDVEAAVREGSDAALSRATLVQKVVIPQPDRKLLEFLEP